MPSRAQTGGGGMPQVEAPYGTVGAASGSVEEPLSNREGGGLGP